MRKINIPFGRPIVDVEEIEAVKKVLESAIANAENNHQLDVDRLYVSECTVGKSMVMKRWRARARGRVGRIEKPFSNLRLVVREREETI